MNLRNVAGWSALTGSLLSSAVCAAERPSTGGEQSRPNIILIMTDQQTASAMSCAGNADLRTPAMDALAEDGVMLSRAYCPFPLSGPCRASLMTGRMPSEIGARDNGVRPSEQAMQRNVGFMLQEAGYETMYAGKWHASEVNIPDNRGFRRICDMDDRTLVESCRDSLPTRDKSKPLFLVASFLNPHEICEYARSQTLPYGEIEPVPTWECPNLPANFMPSTYEPEAIALRREAHPRSHPTATYTQDDWREYLYAYYRLTERVDYHIGKLVALLRKEGLYDNSLIIFCSDHGDGAAAHGWNQKWILQEEVVNVPLIVKAPKGEGLTGVRNDEALSNIGLDVVATICDYAGVSLDDSYRGLSLRRVVEQPSVSLHDEVFIETLLSEIAVRGWAIVEKDYKYVLYNHFRNREQLFDMKNDRGEMVNLAVDRRFTERVAAMRRKMYEWGVKVGDKQLIKAMQPLVESSDDKR